MRGPGGTRRSGRVGPREEGRASMEPVTISLCMIVKDEEERLAECLRAASPWVDEIIVVDTGSTDSTQKIAREHGARVLEYEWDDDFSAARNIGLEAATKDWILVLDADEILSEACGASLRQMVTDPQCIALWLPLSSVVEDDEEVRVILTRAFRNDPRIRFRYRIHEQVLLSINELIDTEGWRMAICQGEVHHSGYLPEVRASKQKTERNERIFRKALRDEPDNLYMLYMYADFLRRYRRDEEQATVWLERTWEKIQDLDDAQMQSFTFTGEVCGLLGMLVFNSGERERGFEIVHYGMEKCRPSAHLLFIYGRMCLGRHEGAEAESAFRRCLQMGQAPMIVPAQAVLCGDGARLGLARALFLQERYEEAAPLAHTAIANTDLATEAVMVWSDTMMKLGRWKELTEGLIERLEDDPICGMSWYKGGEALFRLRLFKKSLPWLLRAGELLEEPQRAHYLAGQAMLALGHSEEAVDLFAAGVPHPGCEAGLDLLAVAYDLELDAPLDPENEELVEHFSSLVASLEHFGTPRVNQLIDAARGRLQTFDPKTQCFLEKALYPSNDAESDAAPSAPSTPEEGSAECWSVMHGS